MFLNEKEKNGEATSGTCKYGYKLENKKYIVNELEAENIINLYKYFISENGDINKTYSDFFIQNFPKKGMDALCGYLRDTAYIGKYKLYRKNIYIDNYIPPIVDIELFENVQKLLKKRQRSGNYITDKTALFAGIAYCAICNKRMAKKADNRVKSQTIRYCCDSASRYIAGTTQKKCFNKLTIREDVIEKYLIDNIKTEAEKYIIENRAVLQKPITKDNNKKIKALENKIYKIKDLYLDDLIDKKTYEHDYKKYTSELEALKSENIEEEKPKDLSELNKLINMDIETLYQYLSDKEKRQFWLSIIDRVEIKDGEIDKIVFY